MPNDNAPAASPDDNSEHELRQKTKELASASVQMLESTFTGLKVKEPGSTANEANKAKENESASAAAAAPERSTLAKNGAYISLDSSK